MDKMDKLLNTYRELGQTIQKHKEPDLIAIGDKNGTTITETDVREKPSEFSDTKYIAFNVTIDNVTYYADFALPWVR